MDCVRIQDGGYLLKEGKRDAPGVLAVWWMQGFIHFVQNEWANTNLCFFLYMRVVCQWNILIELHFEQLRTEDGVLWKTVLYDSIRGNYLFGILVEAMSLSGLACLLRFFSPSRAHAFMGPFLAVFPQSLQRLRCLGCGELLCEVFHSTESSYYGTNPRLGDLVSFFTEVIWTKINCFSLC